MRYGSVCSGIEAATAAWHPLGWEPSFFSEIEQFPSAVLNHHYPDVPNFGDMTRFKEWPDAAIDVLVGGTPCQSFSVAGLRKGLADPRGNLMLTFGSIAQRYKPRWLVWENVPGVLSSHKGRDFGTFLGMLGELGYGTAYRVLDAQYFGVAQRRRRVFVVGCLGDWRRAAAVLLERESLSGHPAPSREARQVAPTIPSRSTAGGGLGTDFDCDEGVINTSTGDVSHCLNAGGMGRQDYETETLVTHTLTSSLAKGATEDGTGRGAPLVPVAFHPTQDPIHSADGTTHALGCGSSGGQASVAVAVSLRGREGGATAELGGEVQNALRASQGGGDKAHVLAPVATDVFNGTITGDVAATMGTRGSSQNSSGPTVMHNMAVRRLTPEECEALQGFPRGYTAIPYRNKPADQCPDGPRYKALGNSMAVPVVRWIGERIQMVEGF